MLCRFDRIALNIGELVFRKAFVFLWPFVDNEPESQPNKPDNTREDERLIPAPRDHYCWYEQRGCQRTHVCSGVEDAGRKCPFFLRKPFRDSFDRGGKVARLAEAQKEPDHHKTDHRYRT